MFLLLFLIELAIAQHHNPAKNKLFPEYGVNFGYIGEVKNGLDRVSVVTSIALPKFKDLQLSPIQFHNCSTDLDLNTVDRHRALHIAVSEWCAKATPYMQHIQRKEKYFLDRLYSLLENDLYSVLPQLKKNNPSTRRKQRSLRALAFSAVTGLITLAVESIGSFLRNKQEKRINDAVIAMRESTADVQNRLQQYGDDFLMYGQYNVETLDKVIETVYSLHRRQTELEQIFAKSDEGPINEVIDAISFSFDLHLYMKLMEEEHVNQYHLLETASRDLLKGITTLGQGRLPRELVSDVRLRAMLKEVKSMIRKQFPDYVLADDSILHYRDMKLVTFAVDRDTHSLIISFPVFVRDFRQPPLRLYEIDTVDVPIPDRNKNAQSYSRVKMHKPYIAVGDDYYIQLKMTELVMCKRIRYTYYCEELFVVKHKSRHSCASAIFYDLGPDEVVSRCSFDYRYNATVPPTILDGGRRLLLANFHGPRSLKCNSQSGGLSKPAPEYAYTVVNREFLCDCRLDLSHHASILRQLSSCSENGTTNLQIGFVVNLGFYEILKHRNKRLVGKIRPLARRKPQTFEVRMSPVDGGRLDAPFDMKEVIDRMGARGKIRHSEQPTGPRQGLIINRKTDQILTILAALMSGFLTLVLLFFIFRHFKLHTLVAGLTMATLPKMGNARLHEVAHPVVCSNPYLTVLATVVTIIASLLWIFTHCKQLTWLRGYKYSRACTMYIFLYNSHFYVPLKIKRLSGHMHMYKIMNPITPLSLSYHKHCLWDSFVVDWKEMKLFVNGNPVFLPTTLTIPMRDKIKTRRMMTKDDLDLQFMIKQGANWYNLTEKRMSTLHSA